jgi:arginine/lysine/ornithine decarboxylase
MKTLLQRLNAYEGSDYYPFHMPGHKRQISKLEVTLPYGLDITEIDGFDDLHHAKGILKEVQEKAAEVFHADKSYYLINGSTVGILSAIMGTTNPGDTILVARNCHKSVYHAIRMHRLEPIYLYPKMSTQVGCCNEITVEEIQNAFFFQEHWEVEEEKKIKAVVITSPTYDGVYSDIKAIANYLHKQGVPLIVDEAHGAHFGFHEVFPKNANQLGADVVIQSVHKTLPSMTQTALLHVNATLVNHKRVERYLDMLQSSSPSYVLMASISECVRKLEFDPEKWFTPYVARLQRFKEKLRGLKQLKLVEFPHAEPSKILISTKGTSLTGKQLYQILLENYHLQMEMFAKDYVLAMTSIMDTEEGFERLWRACEEIDAKLTQESEQTFTEEFQEELNHESKQGERVFHKEMNENRTFPHATQVYPIWMVDNFLNRENLVEKQCISLEDAVGFVSTEFLYLYPPGIPLILPGEAFSDEIVREIHWYQENGYEIEGMECKGKVNVIE